MTADRLVEGAADWLRRCFLGPAARRRHRGSRPPDEGARTTQTSGFASFAAQAAGLGQEGGPVARAPRRGGSQRSSGIWATRGRAWTTSCPRRRCPTERSTGTSPGRRSSSARSRRPRWTTCWSSSRSCPTPAAGSTPGRDASTRPTRSIAVSSPPGPRAGPRARCWSPDLVLEIDAAVEAALDQRTFGDRRGRCAAAPVPRRAGAVHRQDLPAAPAARRGHGDGRGPRAGLLRRRAGPAA